MNKDLTDITIRGIEENDLFNGFLESLDSLRKASDLEQETAKQILKKIKKNPNHQIMIAILGGKVIGSASLFIEQKFIHNGGLVGHIEDVVVSKQHQGKGIGEKLVKSLLEYANNNGCYKTILDSSDDVKLFYEKIGFKKQSNCMRYDH